MSIPVARFFTYVFQPLLMPFIGVLLLLNFDVYYLLLLTFKQKFYILSFIFLLTFVIPALAAIILKSMGYIKTLHMETRQERKLPILITAVIYTALFLMLNNIAGYERIKVFILATTVSIIVSGFITNYYKISIHMTGCGGVAGLLALLSTTSMFNITWLLGIFVILSGLVGVARITLKAHTHMQVYSGFAFGFTVIFLMGWFL